MDRLFLRVRRCKIPFPDDGIRSTVGCEGRTADIVHRCLTTNVFHLPHHDSISECDFGMRLRRCETGPHRREGSFKSPSSLSQQRQKQLQRQRHQNLQFRHFVFDSRKARKSKTKKDPFKVLKVPKESLYKDVKAKFLRIAMNNHPDMHTDDLSEEEQEAMRNKFIEARMAFESIEEDPSDGTAILVEEAIDREKNFDSWFHNETGLKNPFDVDIDPETMKEVAEMTEKIGGNQGMDRDGGMWALARMVTSAVKKGGDAASILRLEAGDVKQRPGSSPGGSLRRPRKR